MGRLLRLLPERIRWAPHNVLAHPISEVAWWLGARRFSTWIHDVTVPTGGGGC